MTMSVAARAVWWTAAAAAVDFTVWVVVAPLVGISSAGLANWASHWSPLLSAFPLAIVGGVATVVQQAVRRGSTGV